MIVIASHTPETLARASRAVESLAMIEAVTNLASLRTLIEKNKPRLVLLDLSLPGIDAPNSVTPLQRLNLDTRIVIIGAPDCDEAELALFRQGVRGCCPVNSSDEHYQRVISAVLRGEVWIRRSLTAQLLEQLGERMRTATLSRKSEADLLAELTKREREIASLVARGENNKIIARNLDITERTVKAHLTEIFRKLEVSDRLKLALLLSPRAETSQQ
jgi:DNA-binding NarL/FixJ family response regulator